MSCRDVLPVQEWYTAAELAGLEGLPASVSGVIRRAKAEIWPAKKREGRGGGKEYAFSSLPQVTQDAILAQSLTSAGTGDEVLEPSQPEAGQEPPRYEDLNEDQIAVMTARVAFVREIERLQQVTTQKKAIQTLVDAARDGDLTPYLAERVERANDRKTATRTLSERTLKRWLSDFNKHGERALAPRRRKADMSVPPWGPEFLKRYQRPQKPSIAAAHERLVEETDPPHPSIDQVRRWLKKLSPEVREKGRRSAQELKALQPFNRRSTDHLWPNDVWVSDGHTFDAEVINPLTGQPFRPEITVVLDWHTRRIVGFALNLAESTLATLDALRHGITNAGMFSLFYVDNGSGFKNEPVYEVVDRLGGTITHSLPYNSQARGAVERVHKAFVTLAKDFDSYIGVDMDKQAATRFHKLSRKAIKNGLKPAHIPTFQEFFDRLSAAVDRYNYAPHASLGKIRDLDTGRLRHQSPMECWASAEAEGFEAIAADADLVASLTRPQNVRKTHRGEVRINGGIYFLDLLRDFHGEEVKVAWDYRDSSSVGVFTLEGEWIGEAELDGNSQAAFPAAVVDRAGDKRVKGQLNTMTKKAKTVTGKDVEIRILEPESDSDAHVQRLIEAGRAKAKELAAPKEEKFQPPEGGMERYRLWQKLDKRVQEGEELKPDEKKWWETYPSQPQFRAIKRVMDASANGKTVSARRAM
ncbi:DNA-binding protein [Marinobacter sp. MCTG268]|uniref:DNA-binding protein n=1 Tax=Marinobacter adhaerens TaxID=1033846 RepID=UPI000AF1D249